MLAAEAILGSIIGAIAGVAKVRRSEQRRAPGRGAIGQTVTRGARVRVPAESLITFRLDRTLTVGGPDDGVDRNGQHYHQYNDRRNYRSRQSDNNNSQN